MRLAGQSNQEGAVLLLVLFILAGLAVTSVELGRLVLLDHAFSLTTRSVLASKTLLASGENLVALFLVRRQQNLKKEDHVEAWHVVEKQLADVMSDFNQEMKSGSLAAEIRDENGFFPIRLLFAERKSELARAEYCKQILINIITALLLRHGYDGSAEAARIKARQYVDELMAWSGQAPVREEAKKWYLSRDPVYYPPEKKPEGLEELLLVYWPDMDEALAKSVLKGSDAGNGLLSLCTLNGPGPINVNTMHRDIALGFSSELELASQLADALEKARLNQGDKLRRGWHREVFSALGVELPPGGIIAEQSRWFRVKVAASIGRATGHLESTGWISSTYMKWVARTIRQGE